MFLLRHRFAILSVLLLMTACGRTPSDMTYRQGSLYLQAGENSLRLEGIPVTEKRTNFKSLFLHQTVLQTKEGNLLVYENAHTDLSYEFDPTLMRIINVVFETRRKVPVLTKGDLHAYQVILSNGTILNLIAQQNNTQSLTLLYGMSTSQFSHILKQLDPDAPAPYYQKVVTLSNPTHAIRTKWDDMKIHFYPLVVPLPRLMMGH